jgi:hypothetical protein
MIESQVMEYTTFEDEKRPVIGVYYSFKNRFRGLCREFRLNIEQYLSSGEAQIELSHLYDFRNESRLLSQLERNKVQGIRTTWPSKIAFSRQSLTVAQIHFDSFLKRHDWLKRV